MGMVYAHLLGFKTRSYIEIRRTSIFRRVPHKLISVEDLAGQRRNHVRGILCRKYVLRQEQDPVLCCNSHFRLHLVLKGE
jgi:hypothetical protein